MSEVTVIGIDLAKNVFELCGQDRHGKVVFQRRVRRARFLETLANQPPCLVGLEACAGAHYWGRRIQALGHRVRLLPPQYVKAYVVGNKNDPNDARAVCEAAGRRHVPEVAIKTPEQLAMQALHRVREQLVKQHTALGNCARGLLHEFGIAVARGHAPLRRALAEALDDPDLPGPLKTAVRTAAGNLTGLADEIARVKAQIERAARADEVSRRLLAAPGIGPITATAFVASVGDAAAFANGRQVSAWLGLVPKQDSSGERTRLLGISKRGNGYLRGLLVHGARSALKVAAGKSDPTSRWMVALAHRRGHNKAVVAIANKNARILWAMMKTGHEYRPG